MEPKIYGGGRPPVDEAAVRNIIVNPKVEAATPPAPKGRTLRLGTATAVLAGGVTLSSPLLAQGSEAVIGLIAGPAGLL